MRTRSGQRLTLTDVVRFTVAVKALLAVDVLVRLFGVRRTQRLLQRAVPLRTPKPASDAEADLGQVALAVDRAGARVCRWSGRCLRRSLVLWAWLRLHGVDAEVHFGVRREGKALTGHAWLTCGGDLIAEPPATLEEHVSFGRL